MNAAIEHIHQTTHHLIMKAVDSDRLNWDKVLPCAVFTYNNATALCCWFYAVLSGARKTCKSALRLLTQHPSSEHYESYDDYTKQVDKRLHYAFNLVRNELKASFERNKRYYDERVRKLQFKPGDFVWHYSLRVRSRMWETSIEIFRSVAVTDRSP
jgi:hypothetical protein